jgi:hypothetical protein
MLLFTFIGEFSHHDAKARRHSAVLSGCVSCNLERTLANLLNLNQLLALMCKIMVKKIVKLATGRDHSGIF